ncbi:MAG: hypothetical protein ACM3IJ_03535 [Candidatus Levyibacteriota bacterium]
MGILSYPFLVVLLWYKDGLLTTLAYISAFNSYCLKLFSVRDLLFTFFRPLKNEYRKNLVVFSIIFGMCVKTFLLACVLGIMLCFFIVEIAIIAVYIAFPLLPIILFLK